MTARGPRQAQWSISARAGDRPAMEAWARRLAGLGLVPRGDRSIMPAIRLAIHLTQEFTDDELIDVLDKEMGVRLP